VKSFLEPQLPLEAALIRTGAVEGVPADAPLADLSYVRLAAGREAVEWVPRAGGEADDLASGALERFLALVALYANPAQGYLSRARLEFAGELDGDYDHLARAAEWQNEER
jgi:ATP-dependent helicase/nuclease subunit B